MFRTLITAAVTLVLAGPAWAAGPTDSSSTEQAKVVTASVTVTKALPTTVAETAVAVDDAGISPILDRTDSPCAPGFKTCGNSAHLAGRPLALPMLYVGSALLNGYDAYSTLRAVGNGARESNPLFQSAVNHPAVFVGMKAAVTVLPIIAAEQMWRNHHRLAAITTMIGTNAFMGWVAVHNAQVINQQGR